MSKAFAIFVVVALLLLLLLAICGVAGPSAASLPSCGVGGETGDCHSYPPANYPEFSKYFRPALPHESQQNYRDALRTPIGEHHYRAFVGPPEDYGDMSGLEFTLLYLSGLRETDYLLDIGCGSLRLGRLAIPFLQPGRYHCIEPNVFLVEDATHFELGNEILSVKSPSFAFNDKFQAPERRKYEYMIAQSIFSHTGQDLLETSLKQLASYMDGGTVFLNTFLHGREGFNPGVNCTDVKGWLYPKVCIVDDGAVQAMAHQVGCVAVQLKWPHLRQTWWAWCLLESRMRCEKLGAVIPEATHPSKLLRAT